MLLKNAPVIGSPQAKSLRKGGVCALQLAGVAMCVFVLTASAEPAAADPPAPSTLSGHGKWVFRGAPAQKLTGTMQVEADHSVTGHVTIGNGTETPTEGDFVGRIAKGEISGTLFGDEGRPAMVMRGRATKKGIKGMFMTRLGATGTWFLKADRPRHGDD